MVVKDFVVSADGHLLEPTDLFRTRLPKHLRDRAVWEEDFEIEPSPVSFVYPQSRRVSPTVRAFANLCSERLRRTPLD